MANRLMTGEGFTLEDFIEQLGMLRKLGPLKNILGMMPGAAKNKELLDQVNDKDLDRAEAIVRSMTPERAPQPQDHQRLAAAAHRQRLRRRRRRGLPAGHELLRGPAADEDADGRRHAGHARDAGHDGRRARPPRQAKAAKNAKGKRKSGDPRKAAARPGVAGGRRARPPAAAAQAAPQSMEELAEMLRDAQAAGGPPASAARARASPACAAAPSALPPAFGGGRGPGNLPAAFGGNKGKRRRSGRSKPAGNKRPSPRGAARRFRPAGQSAASADRVDRVGLVGRLVLAVAQHPGEAQRHAARVARAALHAVEGDLDDQLGADVDGPVVAVVLKLEEPLGLPGQQLVGQALEGLAEHDPAAGLRVAGAQVQVGQPALAPAVTPLDGQHHQVEGVPWLHLDPAGAAPPGGVGRRRAT